MRRLGRAGTLLVLESLALAGGVTAEDASVSGTTAAPPSPELRNTTGSAAFASAPGQALTQGELGQLRIRVEDDDSTAWRGNVLLSHGQATSGYACGETTSDRARPITEEHASVAVRRIVLEIPETSSTQGLLDGIWGGEEAARAKPASLAVSSAQLSVNSLGEEKEGLPILQAKLDPQPSAGTPLEVSAGDGDTPTVAVIYDCWRAGEAKVELRLRAVRSSVDPEGLEVCMQWIKICSAGWSALQITDGMREIFNEAGMNPIWQSQMKDEGTDESITHFLLSANRESLLRLQVPTVETNQNLVKVELSGSFNLWDHDIEVGKDPIRLSLLYTCEFDGHADVTLTLRKSVLSKAHQPESLELTWRKTCGLTYYKHVSAALVSPTQSNRSEAVADGRVLPAFALPGQGEGKGSRRVEVPAEERKSVVEVSVHGDDTGELPGFRPQPDVFCSERRICRASVTGPRSGSPGKRNRRVVQKTRKITVSYVCLRAGTSTVVLTLHVTGHRPIELAWTKRCRAPKVRVGKALTAPQAMAIALGVLGLGSGLICCFCCFFYGSKDSNVANEDQDGTELTPALGAKARPQKLGKPRSPLDAFKAPSGVTYH